MTIDQHVLARELEEAMADKGERPKLRTVEREDTTVRDRRTVKIMGGKAFAANLRAKVAVEAAAFEVHAGRKAGLAVVLVGEDPASQTYVRNKTRACAEAGLATFDHRLAATTSQAQNVFAASIQCSTPIG